MPAKTNEELYEEAERALISEAIGETEQEIFDSAFDNAPDDNDGDTSLEQMDTDDVIDDDIEEDNEDREELPEEGEGEYDDEPPPEKPQAEPERQPTRGVPSGRLREEAEARRAAEAEREAARAEARELRARLENLERNQRQAPPQQQPPQQQGPDMFADPEGWAAAERARIMNEVSARLVNASLANAAKKHGEKFQEAFKAATSLNPQDPANQAVVQRIYNAPDPGDELMEWHKQETLRRDMGNDPQAYVDRLIQERMSSPEFRKQFMDGMRQEASGTQRTNVRLPPSLNGASGGSGHRGRDGNSRDTAYTTRSMEREIFDSAWDD